MNRYEALGILVVFVAIGVTGTWLILSRLWGKRQIPDRWDFELDPSPGFHLWPVDVSSDDWLDGEEIEWPFPPKWRPTAIFDHSPVRPWAHG